MNAEGEAGAVATLSPEGQGASTPAQDQGTRTGQPAQPARQDAGAAQGQPPAQAKPTFDDAAFEAILGGKRIPTPEEAAAQVAAGQQPSLLPKQTPAGQPPAQQGTQPTGQVPAQPATQPTGQAATPDPQAAAREIFENPLFQTVFQAAVRMEQAGMTPEQVQRALSGQGGVAQAGQQQQTLVPGAQVGQGQQAVGQGQPQGAAAPLPAEPLVQSGLFTELPDESLMGDAEKAAWHQTVRIGHALMAQNQALQRASQLMQTYEKQIGNLIMAWGDRDLRDAHKVVDTEFPDFAGDKAKRDEWDKAAATIIRANPDMEWPDALTLAAYNLLGPEGVERRAKSKVYQDISQNKGRVITAKGSGPPGQLPTTPAEIDDKAFENATKGS